MGYVIAAYVIVLGTLLVYGLRLQARRRELMRWELNAGSREPDEPDE